MASDNREFPHQNLGDLVSIASGKLNSADATQHGKYPFFTCGKEVLRINHYEHDREAVLLGGNNANAIFPVFYINGKFTARQRVYVIWSKDTNRFDNRFLYYALEHLSPTFTPEARGTTTQFITLPMLKALKVPLPNISAQRDILRTLDSLDHKISLLRETNSLLEAITQALFKSWFVDFDPVLAKAEGRDPEDVPPEVAELFPSGFEDSELGAIPKGWRVARLMDLTTKIGSGATPRGGKEAYVESGIALVRSQNVYDSEFIWDGLARITDEQAEALSNVELQVGDVLLNITGASILRTCIVDSGVLPGRVNQHVAIIRAGKDIPNRYIHQHLLRKSTKDYLMGLNAGASREAVTKGHIESVPIINPPTPLLEMFHLHTKSMFARVESNASEIRTLADLRDTLLPRLMSGKLRIPIGEEISA